MTKTRILIVDDDPNLSHLSAMILEVHGKYEVRVEHDSGRALAAARQFKPDAVLLDVDMPGKDGGDVAAELAGDPEFQNLPVLFITGLLTKAETGFRQVERGGMPFLAKPVPPELLLKSVAQLLTTAPQNAYASRLVPPQ